MYVGTCLYVNLYVNVCLSVLSMYWHVPCMYRDASLPDKSERRTDIGPDPGRRPGLMSRTKRLRTRANWES